MYKLAAIDLDGTMLNQYGVVTEDTKEAIKDAQKRGTEVIIASGRPIDSIKAIAKEIESKNYFISGNGAILYDIKNNEILYENTLKKSKILDIIKICEENSIFYNIYTEKEIIAKSLNYNVLYYNKENLNKDEENKTHINIVEDIYDYISNREEKVIKITICDNNQAIFNSIMRKLKEIEEIEVLEVSHMSRKTIRQGTEDITIEYFYTEISAKNVDKWNAIEILAEKMGIKREEIIAIGDNINDKKMLENAGLGIAMENSSPEVTQIANYVTANNNEDGVAKALKTVIF
jgi:Cof subfamily protein (haloacid dehalogenase superfamily)